MSLLTLLTDEELYQRVSIDEDMQAFTELYDRYKSPLLAYALKKVSSFEAEDLVQDLFVKLWSHRHKVEIEKFSFYIFRALRNKIIDFFIHSEHVQKYVDSLEYFSVQHFATNADFKVREESFLKRIDDLLIRYGPKAQQIVRLRLQGYSNTEIAEVLGVSEKTVRNQYSLLMKHLKAKLPVLIFIAFFS